MTVPATEGYVVLEFNQASSVPRVLDDTVHYDLGYARSVRDDAQAENSRIGRRELYGVYNLTEVVDGLVAAAEGAPDAG